MKLRRVCDAQNKKASISRLDERCIIYAESCFVNAILLGEKKIIHTKIDKTCCSQHLQNIRNDFQELVDFSCLSYNVLTTQIA